MRRVGAAAALAAVVLALSGCLFGGPSGSDIGKVKDALGALDPAWTVEYVDTSKTNSEGMQGNLAIGLHHDTHIEPGDLIALFAIVADALPGSYRYDINFSITVGRADLSPDLVNQARRIGLDDGYQAFFEHGEIWTTVKEMRRIVKENLP